MGIFCYTDCWSTTKLWSKVSSWLPVVSNSVTVGNGTLVNAVRQCSVAAWQWAVANITPPCSFCRFIAILLIPVPDYVFPLLKSASCACSVAFLFHFHRCLRTRKHWRLHHGDRDDAGWRWQPPWTTGISSAIAWPLRRFKPTGRDLTDKLLLSAALPCWRITLLLKFYAQLAGVRCYLSFMKTWRYSVRVHIDIKFLVSNSKESDQCLPPSLQKQVASAAYTHRWPYWASEQVWICKMAWCCVAQSRHSHPLLPILASLGAKASIRHLSWYRQERQLWQLHHRICHGCRTAFLDFPVQ